MYLFKSIFSSLTENNRRVEIMPFANDTPILPRNSHNRLTITAGRYYLPQRIAAKIDERIALSMLGQF